MVCLLPHPLCTELERATWILPEGLVFLGLSVSHRLHTSYPLFSILTPSVSLPSQNSSFLSIPSLPEYPPRLSSDLCQLCPSLHCSAPLLNAFVPLLTQFILSIFLSAPRFHSPSVILHPLPVSCLPLLGHPSP